MTPRAQTMTLLFGLLALIVIIAWKRGVTLNTGAVLNGIGNVSEKVVGNSNVLGTQSIGPAFLNANRSYLYQPSLMISQPPAPLPNVATGGDCNSC